MRVRTGLGCVAVAAALTGLALPATAATSAAGPTGPIAAEAPLTLDEPNSDCDFGGGLAVCNVAFTGGTAPIAIRWYRNGALQSQLNDRRFIRIGCVVPKSTSIDAVVTDAIGARVVYSTGGVCERNFP
ncbi:MAG TPA: hypothetical protein VMU51_30295 [Mycobacteriales bacterium]|nr:hypothetical protein [Mycobacteriales bacterium]